MLKKFFLIPAITIAMLFISNIYGQELLENSNWEKLEGNTPVNWRFFTYGKLSSITLSSETFNDKKVAILNSDKINGQGYIGQFIKAELPAGKNIVLSGYYRTKNIEFEHKGMLRVEIVYNRNSKDKKFPKKNHAILLTTSEKWKKFKIITTHDAPIKEIFVFVMLYRASGKLYLSDLSLKVESNSSKINSREKYIWREAENIRKHDRVSTWGKKTKDYFSGKGGIYLKSEAFKWNFRIKEEVNPSTLMPEKRNYFVWLRTYGYLGKPAISVFFNKTKIRSFKTQANEQVNAKGEYAGPGKYYWQKAGAFRAAGGVGALNIVPHGRMMLDAIIVTTDSKYAPVQYEARKVAEKNFFADIQTSHAIKSIYRVYGISDKVTTPLVFTHQGKVVKIPGGQKPAIFHVSLPASIKIKNISSHWAGKNWNFPDRWGQKYLTWKKTGSETVDGIKHNKYEVYYYYLSIYTTIFVQADKADFQPGRKLSCKYYLEFKGKKQQEATVPLRSLALKATKAFKTIMIGPSLSNARGFYEEFPDIAKDMVFRGLNIISTAVDPKLDGDAWKKFRNQCIQNKITFLGEYSPFYGSFAVKEKKFQAVSLNGKVIRHPIPPALCINEESRSFRKSLKHISDQGRQGVTGLTFDDEHFNQLKDKLDYNHLTKELFKKYVKKLGVNYVDPEKVVKNKKKYSVQYKAWVDFKCDCMVEIYRKFRKAYLQGIVDAPSSTTFGKKLFIPQILVDKTPEESRINTYWDYKKRLFRCFHG